MSTRDVALAVFIMLIWGGNFVVAKQGLLEIPPMLFMTMRFVLVAACLLPFVSVPRDKLVPLALYGLVLGGLHFSLMFTALVQLDAATAAVLSQLAVPFATLLAAMYLRDRPGWRRLLGMALAFAGAVLIAGEPRFEGGLLPVLLVVGAALAWGVGAVQVKAMGPVDPSTLNGYMALFAIPPLLVLSLILEEGQIETLLDASWVGWGAIAYQSFAVVIVGYGVWYGLLRRNSISVAMPFMLLVPFIGVGAGVVFLDEALTWQLVVGGLITVTGVGIIIVRRPETAGSAQR